jgi:choline dehydrogenase-like flavoprotein
MQTLKAGVTEGQTLEKDLEIGCDVCIIGSGPGGAVAAATLAQAGLGVVVLEEGGYFAKARFQQREDEAYPFLYQDGGQRATKDAAITILQGKAVGGTSVINWTTCFRTPGDVVEHWNKKHGVVEVTSEALAPAFEWAEKRLSIARIPLELANRNNRTLYDGCKKLGYGAELLMRNVAGCAYTGSCGHGCPIDAKQSMLVTLLPDAVNAGAAIVSRCRAQRVVLDGSRVVSVEAELMDAFGLSPTGVRVTVKPRTVIVAGGAINSPALLLRSGVPDGSGRLGRRTFIHPVIMSAGVYDEPIEAWRGAPQSVASHHFAHRGDEVGLFLETAPIHPMLGATAGPGIGAVHKGFMSQLKFTAGHIALAIDGFHDDVEGGRVTLSPSGGPVVDYPIPERIWRAFRFAQKELAKIQLASGARSAMTGHDPPLFIRSEADLAKIDDMPYEACKIAVYTAHQMGGCMMSDDPRQGVVRASDLRHHEIENLHVVDGSVFPTGLGVNPQLSIYGLARLVSQRLADALKRV